MLTDALNKKLQRGESLVGYSLFTSHLRFGADQTLQRVLRAMTQCVALLGKSPGAFEELIGVALGLCFRAVPACDLQVVTERQQAVAKASGKPASGTSGAPPVAPSVATICTLATAEAYVAFAVALVASNPHLLVRVLRAMVASLKEQLAAAQSK